MQLLKRVRNIVNNQTYRYDLRWTTPITALFLCLVAIGISLISVLGCLVTLIGTLFFNVHWAIPLLLGIVSILSNKVFETLAKEAKVVNEANEQVKRDYDQIIAELRAECPHLIFQYARHDKEPVMEFGYWTRNRDGKPVVRHFDMDDANFEHFKEVFPAPKDQPSEENDRYLLSDQTWFGIAELHDEITKFSIRQEKDQ